MRLLCVGLGLLLTILLGIFVGVKAGRAQVPARPAAAAQTSVSARPAANLVQVMRGVLFPNVNIIYAAQNEDPAKIKPA